MLLSIALVTADTLTGLYPVYGLDGVKLCADVVGVMLKDVLFAGDKLPDTPRIDTPDFMLPAVIFASILEVTALTVIVPLPE